MPQSWISSAFIDFKDIAKWLRNFKWDDCKGGVSWIKSCMLRLKEDQSIFLSWAQIKHTVGEQANNVHKSRGLGVKSFVAKTKF